MAEAKKKVRKKRRVVSKAELKRQIAELKISVTGLSGTNEALAKEVQRLTAENVALNQQVTTISAENAAYASTVAGLNDIKRSLQAQVDELQARAGEPMRHRLPDTRQAITHKFDIAGHEGYLTVGLYEDGTPGELFITMAKEGSTIGGLMDTIGTLISLAFQYGVPMEVLVKKFAHQRFEPSGYTKNPDIPIAKSITDYLFRWLACHFIPGYREKNSPAAQQTELPFREITGFSDGQNGNGNGSNGSKPALSEATGVNVRSRQLTSVQALNLEIAHYMTDAPVCDTCGAITVRNGACYKCLNCGNSMGCS